MTDQLNLLENMVVKGYDVIIAHPITAQNIIPGLVKATEKGIITITETRTDIKAAREAGAKPIAIDMVNFYVQGKMGARYIARKLKKKGAVRSPSSRACPVHPSRKRGGTAPRTRSMAIPPSSSCLSSPATGTG